MEFTSSLKSLKVDNRQVRKAYVLSRMERQTKLTF